MDCEQISISSNNLNNSNSSEKSVRMENLMFKKEFVEKYEHSVKKELIINLQNKGESEDLSVEEKMEKLIKVAEEFANFLLIKKNISSQNPKEEQKEEVEETVFLTSQPSLLKGGDLRAHQLDGLNWLISLYSIGFNGILADEMGLGKTIQAISFLAYLYQIKKSKGPYLIVCPNSVVMNWKKEFKKWLPCLNVVQLIARKEFRFDIINKYIKTKNFNVIITSFEGVNICKKILSKIKWKFIIVDEAHRLKNFDSLLSKNLRNLSTEFKLLMTGTPLQNNLKELWSLLNFIMPDLFDDSRLFEDFTNNCENLSEEEREQKNLKLINSLHKILRPFLLKRTKSAIEQSIPSKKEIHVYVGLTKFQTQMYKNLLLKQNPIKSEKKFSMMNVLMHLRKVCNHPFLFEGAEEMFENEEESKKNSFENLVESSGKMIILDKLLDKLRFNHKVLIFSQFTSMLDILEDYLNARNHKFCRIDGTTFMEDREKQITHFSEENDHFVFLLSTRAGGLGINLTSADTVILYDSDWNPQVDLQAMDRVHRIGQTKNVNIYRFITEHTIEEKIVERQKIKLKWDNLLILKGKLCQKKDKMKKEDLKNLIQYGSSEIFKANNGTLRNEDIEELLERGEKKAKELDDKIDEFMKKQAEKILDLGINSINVYEFEGNDYQKKKNKDREVLQEMIHQNDEMNNIKKRLGKFSVVLNNNNNNNHNNHKILLSSTSVNKPPKKVLKFITLPDYQFFTQKKKLEELLSKEANFETLTEEENKLKNELKDQSFEDFSKNDFQILIKVFELFDKNDMDSISSYLNKDKERVKQYVEKVLENVETLKEGNRIKKNIEKYEKGRELLNKTRMLLDWKCKSLHDYTELVFPSYLYSKIRSKIYTELQDKFLIYQSFILSNPADYIEIKKQLLKDRISQFDFYLQSIKESLLAKRINSLLKIIEHEFNCTKLENKKKTEPKKTSIFAKKDKNKSQLSEELDQDPENKDEKKTSLEKNPEEFDFYDFSKEKKTKITKTSKKKKKDPEKKISNKKQIKCTSSYKNEEKSHKCIKKNEFNQEHEEMKKNIFEKFKNKEFSIFENLDVALEKNN